MKSELTKFVRKNPPVTLILISLFALTITAYTFAVHAKQNELLNADVLLNTFQLKKYINDLKVCIKPEQKAQVIMKRSNIISPETSESNTMVTASISLKNLRKIDGNVTHIHGLVDLKDFSWACPNFAKPKYLEIRFNKLDTTVENSDRVCIQLYGPKEILDNFLIETCHSSYSHENSSGIIETSVASSYSDHCTNGTRVYFNFDPRENSDNFSLYITKVNQEIVSNSMFRCTYALSGLLLLAILYIIIFKKETYFEEDVEVSF